MSEAGNPIKPHRAPNWRPRNSWPGCRDIRSAPKKTVWTSVIPRGIWKTPQFSTVRAILAWNTASNLDRDRDWGVYMFIHIYTHTIITMCIHMHRHISTYVCRFCFGLFWSRGNVGRQLRHADCEGYTANISHVLSTAFFGLAPLTTSRLIYN